MKYKVDTSTKECCCQGCSIKILIKSLRIGQWTAPSDKIPKFHWKFYHLDGLIIKQESRADFTSKLEGFSVLSPSSKLFCEKVILESTQRSQSSNQVPPHFKFHSKILMMTIRFFLPWYHSIEYIPYILYFYTMISLFALSSFLLVEKNLLLLLNKFTNNISKKYIITRHPKYSN